MLLYIPQVSLIKSILPAFPHTTGKTMECTTPGGGRGTPHMPHSVPDPLECALRKRTLAMFQQIIF